LFYEMPSIAADRFTHPANQAAPARAIDSATADRKIIRWNSNILTRRCHPIGNNLTQTIHN
jgi:hypothetical protein